MAEGYLPLTLLTEIHDLEECTLTMSEVNGRVGAYMGKFAKLVKDCAAAAQSLVKGFEQAPGDDARKRQVLRCAGKALSRVGDIFKEAGAEQIGPSAAPAPVVLESISPWQFCPNARGPLNEVHKCSAYCTQRWPAAPSIVHDAVTSAVAPKVPASWIAQQQAGAPIDTAVKLVWPKGVASEVAVPAVASVALGMGEMKSAIYPWRASIDNADAVATPALAGKGSFSSSFSATGSVHEQSVQVVAATRAVIAKPAVIAVIAEGANKHRQEPKSVVAPPVTEGPIPDGRPSGLRGTIVNINHGKQYAFIRSPQSATDFFVGRQQFRPQMAMGDLFVFRWHSEVRQRGGRCPDAVDVDLVVRENQQSRQVDPLPVSGAWANAPTRVNQQSRQVVPVPVPPAQGVITRPGLEAQVENLTRLVTAILARFGDGTLGPA